jgi:pimeloyl-ACP methyl ester carboxylesterase
MKKLTEKFAKPIVQNPWLILPFLRANPEKRQMSKQTLLEVAKRVSRSSTRAAVESLQSVLELDLRQDCRNLRIPTLILEGSQTFLPSLATGKKLHQLIPNSNLVFIRGVAHEMPTQKPQEFARAVLNFLEN